MFQIDAMISTIIIQHVTGFKKMMEKAETAIHLRTPSSTTVSNYLKFIMSKCFASLGKFNESIYCNFDSYI